MRIIKIKVEKNLQQTGRDEGYYRQILKEQGCVELKKVLVMTVDGKGKLYLQIKGKPYTVLQLPWKEQLW